MKLKKCINLVEFLNIVNKCQGEVIFETEEGDRLNIKTQLSKFFFITAGQDEKFLDLGEVICSIKADEQILAGFWL